MMGTGFMGTMGHMSAPRQAGAFFSCANFIAACMDTIPMVSIFVILSLGALLGVQALSIILICLVLITLAVHLNPAAPKEQP